MGIQNTPVFDCLLFLFTLEISAGLKYGSAGRSPGARKKKGPGQPKIKKIRVKKKTYFTSF